jgi:hypothetical protein
MSHVIIASDDKGTHIADTETGKVSYFVRRLNQCSSQLPFSATGSTRCILDTGHSAEHEDAFHKIWWTT